MISSSSSGKGSKGTHAYGAVIGSCVACDKDLVCDRITAYRHSDGTYRCGKVAAVIADRQLYSGEAKASPAFPLLTVSMPDARDETGY